MYNLFVYGTLKKGKRNHDIIKDGKFLGKGRTLDLFALYDLGSFPVVIDDYGYEISHIHGEIWRIDDKIFNNVTLLEDALYHKVEVDIQLENSGTIKSWIWISDDFYDDGVLIRSGKW